VRRIVLLALPIGILIGLSLGALGGGGSILTVPALVYLLGVSPHSATSTSLIIVGVTSVAGVAAHLRAGRVRLRSGLVFGILGAGGAFAGSRLSASLNPDVLLAAFSVLMAVAAVAMLRRRRPAVPADAGETGPAGQPDLACQADLACPADAGEPAPYPAAGLRHETAAAGPGGPAVGVAVRHRRQFAPAYAQPGRQAAPVSPVRVVLAATVVGLVTGFFGVGGGFVVLPALVLALGFDMPAAVGTSLLVITINSASSLLSRIGTHATIDPGLIVAFTAAAIAGTVVGSRVATRSRPERLVGAFAVLMIAVALYTAARSIPALV
jgi:uncharacterized membrane protein YfcA